MKKYDFRLILQGAPELTDDLCDDLYASGCDDGTPGTCDSVFSIDFHREADSLEEAINSAIKNVRAAGLDVERVEIDAGEMLQSA